MNDNLVAVTISRYEERWNLPEISYFCHAKNEDIPEVPGADTSLRTYPQTRYLTYLSEKRNTAVDLALKKYPDATDVIMCDRYYLPQVDALRRLIKDYHDVKEMGIFAAIGGAVWGKIRTKIEHHITRPSIEWYDKWGVPDMAFVPHGWRPEDDDFMWILTNPLPGLYRASSLSGIAIWPREIWDRGARYGISDGLYGAENKKLYDSAGIDRYIDFNAAFTRNIRYPLIKSIRVSLHLGRFIRKKPRRQFSPLSKASEFDRVDKYKK